MNKTNVKTNFLILLFILLFPFSSQALELGIVSDIHAGNKKVVSKGRKDWYYPNHYCDNLEGVKNSGVDYILTLGDNTLNGRESEAKKILNCLKGYDVIWTKGNHDKEAVWKLLETPNYYSRNFGRWTIIVLDSSKKFPSSSGGFFPEQLLWLERELLCSENVLIAMHHNIFRFAPLYPELILEDTIFSAYLSPYYKYLSSLEVATVYPEHSLFKHMLEASGKVKYVYSGHVHGRKGCQIIGGINYCSVPALSLKDREGYFTTLSLE